MKTDDTLNYLIRLANLLTNLGRLPSPEGLEPATTDRDLLATLAKRVDEAFAPSPAESEAWQDVMSPDWGGPYTMGPPLGVLRLPSGAAALRDATDAYEVAFAARQILHSLVSIHETHETWTKERGASAPEAARGGPKVYYATPGPTRFDVRSSATVLVHPDGRLEVRLGAIARLLTALERLGDVRRVKECSHCGNFFHAWRRDLGGCSQRCRDAINSARYRERATEYEVSRARKDLAVQQAARPVKPGARRTRKAKG